MPELEIIFIAIILVQACILPGVFLVLRGVSLMSDAISHASLLGIVIAFFYVRSLDSPILIFAAGLTGLITVIITEWLISTKRLKEDAAIGLVFPLFFSIGVILISKYMSSIHIDSDCVLFGEIAFTPFERLIVFSYDLGPVALWIMSIILLVNLSLMLIFYKELKISTFDTSLAKALGFFPQKIHYGLMIMTSITAVGAFESVGSILVVALMITPPATAFLLTKRLSRMLIVSSLLGTISVLIGYLLAFTYDVSISGSIVTCSGLLFLITLFFSPKSGLIIKLIQFKNNNLVFSTRMLLVQLLDHEGKSNEALENTISNMVIHMNWPEKFAKKVAKYAVQKNYILRTGNDLKLTNFGRELARQTLQLT